MVKEYKYYVFIFVAILFLALNFSFVNAWLLNGTTYNENGNVLSNVNISIIAGYFPGGTQPSFPFTNITASNSSGLFNINVSLGNSSDSSFMYQIAMRHTNESTGKIDFVGRTLPSFPYQELVNGINTNFYLRRAGTMNLSVVNGTGSVVAFHYQVMDSSLGYIVGSNWTTWLNSTEVYVPVDRNYSVMVYPNNSMPLSFNWNNFSTNDSYNIAVGLSHYNATTKVLNKTFNTSMTLVSYTGYINGSTLNVTGWDNLTIVPYILQPGNMLFMSDSGYGSMPYNMSAWMGGANTDTYNLSNGSFNITLPGPAENQTVVLFASGKNGSSYYGSYKNITLSYSPSSTNHNFTMYNLLGGTTSNLTMTYANGSSGKKVTTKKQEFVFTNASTNQSTNMSSEAHIEVSVDYSNFGGMAFKFMVDASQGANNFSVPLLNTSVKEINIYSQNFAPKRIPTKTVAQILNNSNVSLSNFNPRALDGTNGSGIHIALYMSNSSCNVPNPSVSCLIGSSGNMSGFNPLSSVIGGGKLNFKMGVGNVSVYYINVDMLASGPPDALFDSNTGVSERTSGGFGKLMRFGSQGPSIYDYVIVSMPYTEGSSSVAGLNESKDVNISVPAFYDEDWNVAWNSSINGTNASAFAGNDTHYDSKKDEWQVLMNSTNCTVNVSIFNSTNPCYIDTTNNKIWLRIPHFSGTGPSISGSVTSVVTTTTTATTTTSTSSSITSTPSFWSLTHVINDNDFKNGVSRVLKAKERAKVLVSNKEHFIGIISMTSNSAVINVSSTPQQATLKVGDEKKFDVDSDNYYDIDVILKSISNNAANVSIKSIHEKYESAVIQNNTQVVQNNSATSGVESAQSSKTWTMVALIIFVVIIIVALIFVSFIVFKKNSRRKNDKYVLYGK